jgi:hypothetical protein
MRNFFTRFNARNPSHRAKKSFLQLRAVCDLNAVVKLHGPAIVFSLKMALASLIMTLKGLLYLENAMYECAQHCEV